MFETALILLGGALLASTFHDKSYAVLLAGMAAILLFLDWVRSR